MMLSTVKNRALRAKFGKTVAGLAVLAAGLVIASPQASALTISTTDTLSGLNFINGNFALDYFNMPGFVLTGVQATYSATQVVNNDINTSYIENTLNARVKSYTVSAEANFQFSGGPSVLDAFENSNPTLNGSNNIAVTNSCSTSTNNFNNNISQCLNPFETVAFSGSASFGTNPVINFSNPVDLAQFIGVGQFNINLFTGGGVTTGCQPNGCSVNLTEIDALTATVNIVYSYDELPPPEAPEPASLALLGAGLAGVSVLRRRKSA